MAAMQEEMEVHEAENFENQGEVSQSVDFVPCLCEYLSVFPTVLCHMIISDFLTHICSISTL